MTRQEFLDEVGCWGDLIDVCSEHGCDDCDNIYSDSSRDYEIEEDLYEMVRDCSWREVLDALQTYDRESGYDYYLRNEYGEFEGLNDYEDFTLYKDGVLHWGDVNDIWDEGEDDDEDSQRYDAEYEEDDIPLEAEDISFEELFA